MASNQFWLSLHHLFCDYMAEGSTPEERASAIVEDFLKMSPIARRELLADFLPLVQHMPDLYGTVVAADREADSQTPTKARAG